MQALKRYLAANHVREAEFARRVGVSRYAVNKWVRGERRPSLERAALIERATEGAVPWTSWIRRNRRAA